MHGNATPFKNCLPERGPSDVRREGESKDPGAVSITMMIQGVFSMLFRANALMLYFMALTFSGCFGCAPWSAGSQCGLAALRSA
jgi:hypothetical protein